MRFDEYQEEALRTAPTDDDLDDIIKERLSYSNFGPYIAAAKIASEAGEILGLLDKFLIQGHHWDQAALRKEAGDLAWTFVYFLEAAGLDPERVFEENIAKLRKRYPDGRFDAAASMARVDTR